MKIAEKAAGQLVIVMLPGMHQDSRQILVRTEESQQRRHLHEVRPGACDAD